MEKEIISFEKMQEKPKTVVEFKTYTVKTNTDQIPYENEIKEYTENQIAI
jgi:hypothetical protein